MCIRDSEGTADEEPYGGAAKESQRDQVHRRRCYCSRRVSPRRNALVGSSIKHGLNKAASLTDAEPGHQGRSSCMEVRAELTATVWKVVVEVGAMLAEGDELVILESMKMEIPVVAPAAGTLSEMRVSAEDRISEGDVIAVIEVS